ncbi:tyrosine-type recombinase/integrase [Robinsoniella peoriensis]
MARRGENIYKRKDGRWEGRYVTGKKNNGKTAFSSVYGKTYTEVKKKLDIYKGKHRMDQLSENYIPAFGDGKLSTWMEHWLEEEIRPHVKESTYVVYRGQIERHILPVIGTEQLLEVNRQSMKKLYFDILEKNISQGTAQSVCKRFIASMRSAYEANLINEVPSISFKKKHLPKKEAKFMTIQEQKILEKNLDEMNKKDIAILLSLYSGIRVGECCALKWENFSQMEKGIQISHTVQRIHNYRNNLHKTTLLYSEPKTQFSVRFIPLPDFMIHLLSKLKKNTDDNGDSFIFGAKEKPLDPRVLQYHIDKKTKSLHIKGVHFHTLRHTFATRFMEKGGDIFALKELLGHSSAKLTMDWYGHSTTDHVQKSMKRMKKLIA